MVIQAIIVIRQPHQGRNHPRASSSHARPLAPSKREQLLLAINQEQAADTSLALHHHSSAIVCRRLAPFLKFERKRPLLRSASPFSRASVRFGIHFRTITSASVRCGIRLSSISSAIICFWPHATSIFLSYTV